MMMAQIADRLFGRPLAISAASAERLDWLMARSTGVPLTIQHADGSIRTVRPVAGTIGDGLGQAYDLAQRATYRVIDQVAIIPIEGALVHKGGWLGQSCGMTSYQGLQAQIVRAAADPNVKGVVFEVDSGGGEVSGVADTADFIARLSRQKPTMAILTDEAYSAAYWLASQARQIVVPENGGAGSIGVVKLHIDATRYLENEGYKVTVLTAGAHKGDGWPYSALSEDVAARIRADLEAIRQTFAASVASGRGKRLTKDAALSTEALTYSGRDAVRLGLADAIGNPHDAFAAFRRALRN